ncbi:Germinal center-associated signaling and motility-like protein [Galemys pyrenaicus]|uniref:Germinal center-associated signaling and motility-like protein n=1 Tax=Galemys pyrenaicus TaxID=202257 RepID=A0A8J6A260_GALPY|nr:Germinal center-associated signaling and motility-like protein [Galemys pyrenaicus]
MEKVSLPGLGACTDGGHCRLVTGADLQGPTHQACGAALARAGLTGDRPLCSRESGQSWTGAAAGLAVAGLGREVSGCLRGRGSASVPRRCPGSPAPREPQPCLGDGERRRQGPAAGRTRQEATALGSQPGGHHRERKDGPPTADQAGQAGPAGRRCEDVCYTVIRHDPHRRPSLSSTDPSYENVQAAPGPARAPREHPETEYALLRTPAGSRPPSCSPEHDYELVLPH